MSRTATRASPRLAAGDWRLRDRGPLGHPARLPHWQRMPHRHGLHRDGRRSDRRPRDAGRGQPGATGQGAGKRPPLHRPSCRMPARADRSGDRLPEVFGRTLRAREEQLPGGQPCRTVARGSGQQGAAHPDNPGPARPFHGGTACSPYPPCPPSRPRHPPFASCPSSPDDAAEHALPVYRLPHGVLRSRGVDAVQEDLALALVLRLLSPEGLRAIAAKVDALPPKSAALLCRALPSSKTATSPPSAPPSPFLQGRDSTLATASWAATTCPRGRALHRWMYVDDEGGDPLGWAFGAWA